MKNRHALLTVCAAVLLAATFLAGCDQEEDPLAPPSAAMYVPDLKAAPEIEHQTGDTPPAGLVTIGVGGGALTFWPYTGGAFDGRPIDPINLVFVGEADPLQIRAALLALPPGPPFHLPWTDAIGGDVQTTYAAEGHGWAGSVVQLTLGEYGPVRIHLRLFRTGVRSGEGCVTLGGAHFELHIPGTADHQVLSWELAERLVVGELMRTGLLDPGTPMSPTGAINAAPSYRSIPAVIYNLLPPDLVALIQGPPQPAAEDVPLGSDGQGTVLFLAGAAPVVPGEFSRSVTLTYDQVVPKPFCVDGPFDYILIQGPVRFALAGSVDAEGRYRAHATYNGELMITPLDVLGGTPVPSGPTSRATVAGKQDGFMDELTSRILSSDRRLILPPGGPEMQVTRRAIPQNGLKTSRQSVRCLTEE